MSDFGFRHSDFRISLASRCVFAEAVGHADGRVTGHTSPGALEWLWGTGKKGTRHEKDEL